MDRRLFVSTVAVGGLSASAGCLGGYLDDLTSFAASPAAVAEPATDEAGYDYQGTERTVETKDVFGTRVEATNYISGYHRTIDVALGPFEDETESGVFGVITTPKASLGDEHFNPVGDMTHAEIAERVQSQYDELEVADEVTHRRTVDAFGGAITVDTFEAEASFQGALEVDAFVDISQPDHDGDHVVVVGIYPDHPGFQREAEAERIDTMIAGLRHGSDVDVTLVTGEF
ncbi:DUF6517 family protein [Halopiger djelfimassiliensis]|uniref:DUF6517 family protein n=1 Tax=Halopiger djelfimassiliensis TaxID=1293047 RepID=UPI000677ED37|nr:DUF6517 family protein [Halopiger djelfimassiliensis]